MNDLIVINDWSNPLVFGIGKLETSNIDSPFEIASPPA